MSSSTNNKELPKAEQFPTLRLLRNSSIWLYAAKSISSESYLREMYRNDEWLWDFIDPLTQVASSSSGVPHFTSSRGRFMADSTVTLQRLQSFENDLRIQELARSMLETDMHWSPESRDCYIYICAEIIARDEDEELSATRRSPERAAITVQPYNPPALEKAHSRHLKVAKTILSQKEQLQEKRRIHEKGKKEPLQTCSLLPPGWEFKIVNT